jgi:hypothetical protein
MSPSNSKTKKSVPKRKAAKGASSQASKKGRVASNKTIVGHRGRLKDSNGCYTSYDEDDNNFNDDDSSLEDNSPQQQLRKVPSKPASTQAATTSSTGQASALQKENDALSTKLHMATRQAKMKQLINEEDEMVVMKLCRFVKEHKFGRRLSLLQMIMCWIELYRNALSILGWMRRSRRTGN